MNRRIILASCIFAALAYAGPAAAQQFGQDNGGPNASFVVDVGQAESGKGVFNARGCNGCHTVGRGDLSAPDLGGLLERRSQSWIKRWLRDPTTMLNTDDTAKEMLKQYNYMRMPNLKLSEDEITALMHYIAAETKAAKSGGSASQ
jgi:protein SCO1/2